MGAYELVIEKKTAVSNVNQISINWKLIVMGVLGQDFRVTSILILVILTVTFPEDCSSLGMWSM